MSRIFARFLPIWQRLDLCFLRSLHTKLLGSKRFLISGSLTSAGVLSVSFGGYVCYQQSRTMSALNVVNCQDTDSIEQNKGCITLYQFASCPFCNKVRTFLDYYGMKYNIVEVDPLFKNEIKFSKLKKVPIVIIQGIQLNESSLIISILRSYLLKQDSLEQLLKYYPPITIQDPNSHENTVEYANRYGIMFKEDFSESQLKEIRLERKWRKWVDDTFVHTLSPNIYRTWREAMEASQYFSHVGEFSTTQKFLAKYVGSIIMYLVGKKMKKKFVIMLSSAKNVSSLLRNLARLISRYRLKDDVREAMYDEVKVFLKAKGKKRFLGGKQPNLADLAMFGVLRGIEGLSTVEDLKKHTDIEPWFDRMKHAVETHQGASRTT